MLTLFAPPRQPEGVSPHRNSLIRADAVLARRRYRSPAILASRSDRTGRCVGTMNRFAKLVGNPKK